MNDHTGMTRGAARHFSGITFNSTLVVALVAVALAGIVVLSGVVGVFSSAFAGSIHEDQPREVIDKLVADHDAQIKQYQDRFKNRYVFFKPPPPPPPRPKDPPQRTEPVEIKPPEPAGPPATYPGPSIAWVIGDDVYFNLSPATQTEKYMRVKVGEERNGTKVINVDKMPRTVRVGHSGGEYDVKVFGESSLTSGLFPTSPRPSILTPGLIPAAEAQATPTTSEEPGEPEAETDAAAAKAAAEAEAEASGVERPPANHRSPPPPGSRGDRGESPRDGQRRPRDAGDDGARRQAEESGEKPDSADGSGRPIHDPGEDSLRGR